MQDVIFKICPFPALVACHCSSHRSLQEAPRRHAFSQVICFASCSTMLPCQEHSWGDALLQRGNKQPTTSRGQANILLQQA